MPHGSPIFDNIILAAADGGNILSLMMPIVMIGVLFYLLIVRPEKRKQSDVAKMQANLKKNDHVWTAGGMFGVVVNAPPGSREIVLRVDEGNNTRIRILRSSIVGVAAEEKKTDEQNQG